MSVGKIPQVEIVKTDGVRFTVPGHYGDREIDGRTSWLDFASAVAAARSTIRQFDHRGVSICPTISRAFVALRMSSRNAMVDVGTVGSDREVIRWEVFRDRVVLIPSGQGGLTAEQHAVAFADTKSLPLVAGLG